MVLLWGNIFMMVFSQSRNCVITQYIVIIIEEMSFVTQSVDCLDSISVRGELIVHFDSFHNELI